MTEYRLYGTYLTFLVEQTLSQAEQALTVRQIAEKIDNSLDKHSASLLRRRISKSLKELCITEKVKAVEKRKWRNLSVNAYQKNIVDEEAERDGDNERRQGRHAQGGSHQGLQNAEDSHSPA